MERNFTRFLLAKRKFFDCIALSCGPFDAATAMDAACWTKRN